MSDTDNGYLNSMLIILEIIIGIILGSILLNFNGEGTFASKSYFSGIVKLYGSLSFLFFLTVYAIGIIGQNILGPIVKFKKAIYFSIVFWIVSLIVYTYTFNFFSYGLEWREIPVYMILIGIIFGFNLGIYLEGKKNRNNDTPTKANT